MVPRSWQDPGPFTLASDTDFRKLVLSVPGSSTPALESRQLVADLHVATAGYPGLLFECLKQAAAHGLSRDRNVTEEDVRTYWPVKDEDVAS